MGFTNQQVNVKYSEDSSVLKFEDPDSDVVIYLSPDLSNGGGAYVGETKPGLNETAEIIVDVSHVVSIVLPVQPEWWLQLVQNDGGNDGAGLQEMETEVCELVFFIFSVCKSTLVLFRKTGNSKIMELRSRTAMLQSLKDFLWMTEVVRKSYKLFKTV